MRLTQSNLEERGHKIKIIQWEGKRVRVYCDAVTALRVAEMLEDEQLDAYTKRELLEELLIVNKAAAREAIDDFIGFLAEVAWEVAKVDMTGDHASEPGDKVIDWDKDAKYIEATLWQTYSMSAQEMGRKVSLEQFVDLLANAPYETPMGQAIHYRIAEEPKRTKYNEEEIKHFRKMRDFWALEEQKSKGAKNCDARMTDAGLAFIRMAKASKNNG